MLRRLSLAFSLIAMMHSGSQARIVHKTFDEGEFETLLSKMIAVGEHLQNNPKSGKIPKERLVADIVKAELSGLISLSRDPGHLTLDEYDYSADKSRPNLVLTYHGTEPGKVVTFMGSHMDVVLADAAHASWKGRNPFKLTKERDTRGHRLYGRGTTDCLGHVAMETLFAKRLAQEKPKLQHSVVFVFIANEEDSTIPNIGVDEVAKHGHLKGLEKGPVYWVDTADTLIDGPCTGTGGVKQFFFNFKGLPCHSGLPSKGVNAIELQSEFVCQLKKHFDSFFSPKFALEKQSLYAETSTCKPTQIINGSEGALNQILGECKLGGDFRYTPHWSFPQLKLELESFVGNFNQQTRQKGFLAKTGSGETVGSVNLEWTPGAPHDGFIADLSGVAYKQAVATIRDLTGKELIGYSTTGSLPLVAEMRAQGFDLLGVGFGVEDAYHMPGEYAYLEDFATGSLFMDRVVERIEYGL